MNYSNRSNLIAYIHGMVHSCFAGKGLVHLISACPHRAEVVADFIEKYKQKKWIPSDRLQWSDQEEYGKRGQIGVIKYVKKDTRN